MSPDERNLLTLILNHAEFEGRDELLTQVEHTGVVGGTATFSDLIVKLGPKSSTPDGPIPIKAKVASTDGGLLGEILVWVSNGFLSALEYAWYTDAPPTSLPHPSLVTLEG
jgi:hypothetical protein